MLAPPFDIRPDEHREGVLAKGTLTALGTSAVGIGTTLWDRELRIGRGPLFAFPHSCVRIVRDGAERVADACGVVAYNTGSVYRRRRIAGRPDLVSWVWIEPRVLGEMLEPYWPGAVESPEPVMPFQVAPCDAPVFRAQAALLCRAGAELSALEVDERLVLTVGTLVAHAARQRGLRVSPRRALTARRRAEGAERMKELLGARLHESLTLDAVAREAGLSTFHACRIFRTHTGRSVHGYLTELRMRRAMLVMSGGGVKLTHVAFEHGFSSHAHFTDAFRQWAGVPPSAWRDDPCLTWPRDSEVMREAIQTAAKTMASSGAALAADLPISSVPHRVRA